MVCPNCKTEYQEGFSVCSDCQIALVSELPPIQNPTYPPVAEDTKLEKVFETWDSYQFLDASNILKNAGIPFTGDERYTGELRAGKREQAPYVWTILVPTEKREEALQLLDEKISGQPIMVSQDEVATTKPTLAWMLLATVAVIAILFGVLVWKL